MNTIEKLQSGEIGGLGQKPDMRNRFISCLLKDLEVLEKMLDEGYFKDTKTRIGAEQELDLIDSSYNPAALALKILEKLDADYYAPEFALFNLEINSSPHQLSKNCFTELQHELELRLAQAEKVASESGARAIITGILPTLKNEHLTEKMLTPLPRYQELASVVKQMRGDNYEFHIKNIDELITRTNPGTFGGAFTSFQFHLQVHPEEIVSKFNWSQALLGPLLAMAVNSPLFLGKRLWHETRVPLFQQSTDIRRPYSNIRNKNARVNFGSSWLKSSVLELFHDNLTHYPALIGTSRLSDSAQELEAGSIPQLEALQFYNGTIYPWNRICYGITEGVPHLRIENRIFPAGPTMTDQIANAAFWTGLITGMPDEVKNIANRMNYSNAASNFQKAARHGLEVEFVWLDDKHYGACDLLLDQLLPIARQGLIKAGVSKQQVKYYLGIIEARIKSKKTGAGWILSNYNKLLEQYKPEEAMEAITSGIYARQKQGKPVHTWADMLPAEGTTHLQKEFPVSRIMTTDIISVNQYDPLKMATHLFTWKSINHLPVENDEGKLCGLLSKRKLFDLMLKDQDMENKLVGEIMQRDFKKVKNNATISEALEVMLDSRFTCLPVVDDRDELVGLLTQYDFVKFSSHLMESIKQSENIS